MTVARSPSQRCRPAPTQGEPEPSRPRVDRGGGAATPHLRRAAPAAIRRLGRRLTSDLTLKDQACDFIAYYDRMINQALMAKDARQALISLLNSDSGRAYLLCDAAINDLI